MSKLNAILIVIASAVLAIIVLVVVVVIQKTSIDSTKKGKGLARERLYGSYKQDAVKVFFGYILSWASDVVFEISDLWKDGTLDFEKLFKILIKIKDFIISKWKIIKNTFITFVIMLMGGVLLRKYCDWVGWTFNRIYFPNSRSFFSPERNRGDSDLLSPFMRSMIRNKATGRNKYFSHEEMVNFIVKEPLVKVINQLEFRNIYRFFGFNQEAPIERFQRGGPGLNGNNIFQRIGTIDPIEFGEYEGSFLKMFGDPDEDAIRDGTDPLVNGIKLTPSILRFINAYCYLYNYAYVIPFYYRVMPGNLQIKDYYDDDVMVDVDSIPGPFHLGKVLWRCFFPLKRKERYAVGWLAIPNKIPQSALPNAIALRSAEVVNSIMRVEVANFRVIEAGRPVAVQQLEGQQQALQMSPAELRRLRQLERERRQEVASLFLRNTREIEQNIINELNQERDRIHVILFEGRTPFIEDGGDDVNIFSSFGRVVQDNLMLLDIGTFFKRFDWHIPVYECNHAMDTHNTVDMSRFADIVSKEGNLIVEPLPLPLVMEPDD